MIQQSNIVIGIDWIIKWAEYNCNLVRWIVTCCCCSCTWCACFWMAIVLSAGLKLTFSLTTPPSGDRGFKFCLKFFSTEFSFSSFRMFRFVSWNEFMKDFFSNVRLKFFAENYFRTFNFILRSLMMDKTKISQIGICNKNNVNWQLNLDFSLKLDWTFW